MRSVHSNAKPFGSVRATSCNAASPWPELKPGAAHLLLAFAPAGVPFWGYLAMAMLGFGYSLVPAALWPSVPKIVPDKILGTTFALIYWVQNLGLLVFKRLAGGILGSESGTPVTVELMFTGLCVLALVTALLFAANSRKHPELRLDAPSR